MKEEEENKRIVAADFNKYIKKETQEEFIKKRYEDFVAIQCAWMDFDYNALREKTTDELYNQYIMQLETLKVKKQQNIMKDFEFFSGEIVSVSKENNKLYVTIKLCAEFYDFIIDTNKQEIIRGTRKDKEMPTYEMIFVKSVKTPNTNCCPNCGAKLNKKNIDTCEFCKTKITKETEDWLLASKKISH